MTREELIEMTGNDCQADYAMQIILKNIKKPLVEMMIRTEIKAIDAQVEDLMKAGIIYKANGTLKVDWMAPDRVFGDEPGAFFRATEEQKKTAQDIEAKCYEADGLLYRRNRTNSLIALR